MTINTDNWPGETTWELLDENDEIVESGGPYNAELCLYTTAVCLDDGCYTLNVYDFFGDGICCNYGEGSWSIEVEGIVSESGGEFFFQDEVFLCAGRLHE